MAKGHLFRMILLMMAMQSRQMFAQHFMGKFADAKHDLSKYLQIPLKDFKSHLDPEPEFIGMISNVTLPAGREATMTCAVRNLGQNKVSHRLAVHNMKHKSNGIFL